MYIKAQNVMPHHCKRDKTQEQKSRPGIKDQKDLKQIMNTQKNIRYEHTDGLIHGV